MRYRVFWRQARLSIGELAVSCWMPRPRNALLLLNDEQRRRGVIAASAGNHALGLAYHGHLLSIGVTVVMPKFAPLIKLAIGGRLGAQMSCCMARSFREAVQHAL